MEWICLLLPACVAMKIRYRRNKNTPLSESILMEIFRWSSWVIGINFIVMCVITYLLGYGGVLTEAFSSFRFAIKYMLMAVIVACILPYAVEIAEKYIGVTLRIERMEKE